MTAAVAVFPVANLSGGGAPAGVREFLVGRLASAGFRVLADAALEDFMARHRVRYTAGIDAATAEALRKETGVESVVIPSVELSSEIAPPKVALFARLVSIKAAPAVVWADDVGLAGDDAPGWFELGVENDHGKLLARALGQLSASLIAYLRTGEIVDGPKCADTFRPRTSYRSAGLDPGKSYSVAVLPFYNLSPRRNAGEILALHFVRHLAASQRFRVAEIGMVRQQLLDARIIMDAGLSIGDAETVAALVDADFVLGGRVIRYEDYEGPGGARKSSSPPSWSTGEAAGSCGARRATTKARMARAGSSVGR